MPVGEMLEIFLRGIKKRVVDDFECENFRDKLRMIKYFHEYQMRMWSSENFNENSPSSMIKINEFKNNFTLLFSS